MIHPSVVCGGCSPSLREKEPHSRYCMIKKRVILMSLPQNGLQRPFWSALLIYFKLINSRSASEQKPFPMTSSSCTEYIQNLNAAKRSNFLLLWSIGVCTPSKNAYLSGMAFTPTSLASTQNLKLYWFAQQRSLCLEGGTMASTRCTSRYQGACLHCTIPRRKTNLEKGNT